MNNSFLQNNSRYVPFSQHWLHHVACGCLVMAMMVSPVIVSAQNATGGGKQVVNQQGKVTYKGVVIDDTDMPLPGVSVTYKHAKGSGAITNIDGEFQITVPDNVHELTFSYVGMKTQTIRVSGNKKITVRLESDAVSLKEAVVTGIYTRNVESFTGSMSTFKGEELKAVGNQGILRSLSALDPSFILTESNITGSNPNAMLDISINGKTNIVGLQSEYETDPNQPLFILDGFETTLQVISDLSMDRVESITILKDAASTAIYGSKAANGVVVVETKKPEPGRLRFSYNGNYQVAWADLSDYNLMNSSEKLLYEKLAGRYGSLDESGEIVDEYNRALYYSRLKEVKGGLDSYWLNEPLRTALTQSHRIFVDGGDSAFTYGLDFTYQNTQGVMKGSDRDAASGNIRLTYRVDKFSFNNSTTINYTGSSQEPVPFRNFYETNPFYRKVSEDGEILKYLDSYQVLGGGTAYVWNPLWDFNQNSFNDSEDLGLTNNFQIEWRALEELRVRGRFGLTLSRTNTEKFVSPDETVFADTDKLERGTYNKSNSSGFTYNGSLDITYGKSFGKHMINAVAGMNVSETNTTVEGFGAYGYLTDQFWNPNFSTGYPEGGRPSSSISKKRSASYYANLNYGYDLRYLLDFNVRSDGASTFGINNPFTTTWSFGASWNVYNEKFFPKNDIFDYLKIRYTVGNPGNENFDAKLSSSIYSYRTTYQNPFGLAALISSWGNNDLKWQRTLNHNFGIDLGFFDKRLNLTVDYFIKDTDPLLLNVNVPASVGASSAPMNIGATRNEGVTATLNYAIIKEHDFYWNVNANMRHIKTTYRKIGDLLDKYNEDGRSSQSLRRYYDNASTTALWAVPSKGIDPMTGNEIFITKDNSYTFSWDVNDERVCGDSTPDVEGYFGTSAYYKGFSFNISFQYRYGGQAFLSTLFNKVENISSDDLYWNQDKRALYDRWQKPGDIAKFKRIDDTSITNMSSRFIADENTLQCRSISVGYETTTASWLNSIGASAFNVRIYMEDIFRLSTIKEERGTDYPFQRAISASLGLRF